MSTNVVVLAQARTGSNLLCNVFAMLSPCRDLNEVFLSPSALPPMLHNVKWFSNSDVPPFPHHYFFNLSEKIYLFNYLRVNDYPSLLSYITQHPAEIMDLLDKIIPVTKIIKILDYQMESADLEFLFQRKNTKFVLLERSNKLEQFVSHETSKKIDKWINADTSNVKIHVDRTEFTNFVNKSTAWYEKIRTRLASEGHNFLEINYERDLNHENLDPVVLKVKDWLATQSIDTDFRYTDIQYKKQNLSPMSEKISNFDEISDIFDTLSNSS